MEENNYSDFKYYLEDLNYQINKSYRTRNRLKLILRIYIFTGLLLFISATIYFLITLLKFTLNYTQQTVVIIGTTGLLISLIAKFTMDYLKEKEKENELRKIELDKLSSFIMNWATLEKAINKFSEFKNKENSPFTIGKNLDMLFKEGIISNREYSTLEKALDIRNGVVHGKISAPADIEKYSNSLLKITDKIIENSR